MKKILLPIVAPLIVIVLAAFLVKLLPAHAAGEPLTISAPVTLSGTNTISAPKFIDTTGSGAYFLDPSAATSLVVAGTVTAPTFSGALSGNATTATNFNNGTSYSTAGTIYATILRPGANGAAYLCGGDDACLYDVNAANTVGIYGAQNSAVATLRLGSGAADISGSGGNVGIGTTNPQANLTVTAGGAGNSIATIFADGGDNTGVYGVGTSYGLQGSGVVGVYAVGTSISGVYGVGNGATSKGVYGEANSTSGAVYGRNYNTTGGYGVYCYSPYAGGCGGNMAWNGASDARLKKDIVTIPNALDKVMHLRGVNFNWIEGGGADMGFIAQEALPYVPEIIGLDTNTGMYGMRTSQLTGLLVEAVKDQQGQIASIQKATGNLTLSGTGDLEITGGVDHPVVKKGNISILNSFGAFTELVAAKIRAGIIETKKLIVDGVDVAAKLSELSGRIDKQEQTIRQLQTEIQQLKANR